MEVFVRGLIKAAAAALFAAWGVPAAAAAAQAYEWPVTTARWSEADERGYEAFIQAIAGSD
ncbi:MAG: hypothetical protein IT195_14175, partial [Microthrixaceae bacterium]|nr:hypothetical protein [Microthrixaceae bacterium]